LGRDNPKRPLKPLMPFHEFARGLATFVPQCGLDACGFAASAVDFSRIFRACFVKSESNTRPSALPRTRLRMQFVSNGTKRTVGDSFPSRGAQQKNRANPRFLRGSQAGARSLLFLRSFWGDFRPCLPQAIPPLRPLSRCLPRPCGPCPDA